MTEIPDGWHLSTIGKVAEIVRGVTYSKADTLSANDKDAIPLLRATNLEVDSIDFEDMVYVPKRLVKAQQYLKLNDIFLAASSGSITVVGKSAQVVKTNGETFGAFCAVIRPKEIHPKYLSYWVQSPEIRDHWSATAKGTNINNLKPSDISGTKIPIPPIDEQHKIVERLEDHLSRIDAALADVKQAKLKAAQFRRSLLQAAFTGNLGSDGTRLMTELPDEWKRVTLNDLGNWVTGATPQSKDPLNFGDEVEFVTPSDIGYGGRLGVVERRISELGASRVRKLKAPSVNLVCIGTIGKVALANREVTTNQQINSLEPNESVVLPNFAMWLLASPKIQEALWQASSSTTVAILNKGNLCKIETSIPPLPEQHKIVEILEEHLSRLDASVALADAMEKQSAGLRRSLLQAAFTGQLTKEVASV